MTPIRVALIGLSASAKVSWAEDAHLAYLNSPFGKKHYTLVALLNSSVKAAETAKQHYDLPCSVKTYGDPEALAADRDIDLVVCNTRVDVHLPTIAPSLRAGKGVYVEWPLTENLARAYELVEPVSEFALNNSIVGLQGRVMPITLRLKDILASGTIGTVLSSHVSAYGNLLPTNALPDSLSYFADRKVGGNPVNIHFGHLIDYVHEVLGEWEKDSVTVKMQIQRPELGILGANGEVKGSMKSDIPDLVAVQGMLKKGLRGANIVPGAMLTATSRHGQAFKGQPGLVWTINGTKGELLITAPGPYLMSGDSYNGLIKIQLHDHASDEVRELEWDWPEWQKRVPLRARSVGELYERYAEWVEGGKRDVKEDRRWPTLEDGVRRMEEFDVYYKQHDPKW